MLHEDAKRIVVSKAMVDLVGSLVDWFVGWLYYLVHFGSWGLSCKFPKMGVAE